MRKKIDVSAEEYSEIVDSFYTYFENGYKFKDCDHHLRHQIGITFADCERKEDDNVEAKRS